LPLTRIASPISSSERKPPVPSSRREWKALSAMTSGSSWVAFASMLMGASSPLDRGEDLHAGAGAQRGLVPRAAPHDLAVDGDGDAARVERDPEQRDRVGDGRAVGQLVLLAV